MAWARLRYSGMPAFAAVGSASSVLLVYLTYIQTTNPRDPKLWTSIMSQYLNFDIENKQKASKLTSS